jgi:hypothetical protein
MYARVDGAANLKTAEHLYYLSGKLIFTGKVDARGCEQGGLLDNGSANACGEQRAFSTAVEWQNQYNVSIEAAGDAYRLPARVLKGIIAQESQFWPEPGIEFEYGLGSLSENGIDTLFTWDTPSYLAVCLPALGEDACQTGYDHLSPDQRAYLRGLALRAIGTDQEIDLIARTLKACSVQVGQMVRNETDQAPGKVTTYEDLWNLTIANYHAGAGCMAEGISKLVEGEQAISYENFCAVNASCPTACVFVERVLGYISP